MPENDPIGVDHRDHVDQVVFPDELGLLGVPGQKPIDDSIADEGALSLTWMLPGHDDDGFSCILLALLFLSDEQGLNVLLAQSLTHMQSGRYIGMLAAY